MLLDRLGAMGKERERCQNPPGMEQPQISADGTCPRCAGSDWTLAKMIAWGNSFRVDTESSGTTGTSPTVVTGTHGTVASELASRYAPPTKPGNYASKERFIRNCEKALQLVLKERQRMNFLALDRTTIEPGILMGKSSCDSGIRKAEAEFDWSGTDLFRIHLYEERLAIWEATRVCQRCGTCFLTEGEKASAHASFEMPRFVVPDEHKRCPQCQTYQWKTSSAYFAALKHRAEGDLESAQSGLKAAEEFAADPKPGLLKKALHKLSFVPALDEARDKVAQVREKISGIDHELERFLAQHRDQCEAARVCCRCEAKYVMEADQPRLLEAPPVT